MSRGLVLLITVFAGCSDPAPNAEGEGESGVSEGEGEIVSGEGEADSPDAGPALTLLGMEARPSNASCVAPPRPAIGSGVTLVDPWPFLNIRLPIFLTEEPGTNQMYVAEKEGRIVRFDKNDFF